MTNLDKLKILSQELEQQEHVACVDKERQVCLIMNGVTDMVVITDPDGTIKFANPSSFRVLGYDPTYLIGKNIKRIIRAFDMESSVSKSMKIKGVNREGKEVPLHIYVGELVDSNLHLLIAVLKDLDK